MAATKLTPVDVKKFNEASAEFTLGTTAVDATDGAYFEMAADDHKYTVILANTDTSAAVKATVKAGDGVQGVDDYEVSIAASKAVAINLESGRFAKKNVITITGASNKIGVLVIKNA